ncbi:hypothetical protein cand_011210 [Cryptosporidium andersoni]|uniref:Nitrogen permease regulator 2 n=1 Tax=Cryptosporidium andersoni TaxID=117008 RepID=A0A1J4MSF7_9CRYT|nr:hypothetical protein cand_011210 [Cryptosporidium andersoni]
MRIHWEWPNIEGILFCKFDEELGPIVLCKDPAEIFGANQALYFSLITRYMVPDAHFSGSVISFVIGDKWRVVGMPIVIQDNKYLRNSFQFTVCIVINNINSIQLELFSRHIAKILGYAFKQLEEDSGTVYSYCTGINDSETRNISGKLKLQINARDLSHILQECRIQLNRYHKVCIDISKDETLSFYVRNPSYKCKVQLIDVPVPLYKHLININLPGIDISLMQIIPYINGRNTSYEIAKLSLLPFDNVILCLEYLIYYGLIGIIDMFSLDNMYRYIGYDNKKYDNTENLYISLSNECSNLLNNHKRNGCVRTFQQKFSENLENMEVRDIRLFIIEGILKQKIKRIHEYPIIFNNKSNSENPSLNKFKKSCLGLHSLDYIQVMFGYNSKEEVIQELTNSIDHDEELYWAYY